MGINEWLTAERPDVTPDVWAEVLPTGPRKVATTFVASDGVLTVDYI